jgi:ribosomal protein L29
MKKQNIQDLKNKSTAELQNVVKENRAKLRQLNLDFRAGKVKNVKTMHELKKEIARALTFIKQKKQQSP